MGVKGTEVADQQEAATLAAERDKLELAMMVHAYTSERRFIESQGTALGTAAIELEEAAAENPSGPAAPPAG